MMPAPSKRARGPNTPGHTEKTASLTIRRLADGGVSCTRFHVTAVTNASSPHSSRQRDTAPTRNGTAGPSCSSCFSRPVGRPRPHTSPTHRGGYSCRVRRGEPPRGPAPLWERAVTILWRTCPGTTRWHSVPGPGLGCRPKRNGSSPREAARNRPATRGATISLPVASTVATSGKERPRRQFARGRLSRNRAGQGVPAQRLRPVQRGGKCLGMDLGPVRSPGR